MSKNIRIKTIPGGQDTTLTVNLEQEFDFLEILSLKISQEEVYRRFCSDYGTVVGRIIANGGFGVPNAKVSIFVPLSEDDEDNEIISSIYPYKTVYDKNNDGVKYNLLPDSSQFDCHTPVGTYPSKRKVLDNDDVLEVYEKYYKYTTTTNSSGDYMLFGVPLGNQMIHVDLDLSDMGILSQRPYDFIRQGHSEKSFDSPTKFSDSNNLDSLSQIVTQNMGVIVTPFWGDLEDCQVGITRVDVDLNHRFEPCAIFMGSIFGDNEKNSLNKRCWPRKKLGELCDTVTSEGTIEMIRKDTDGRIEPFSPEGGRVIDQDGTWAYQIPMNTEYRVTDETGNLVPSEDPTKGIPTKSRVRFRIGMDQTGGEGKFRTRAKYLVPNNPINGATDFIFDETTPDTQFTDLEWNKLYTVRQFTPRYQRNCTTTTLCANTRKFTGIKDVDDCGDHTPFPYNRIDTDINPLYIVLNRLMQIITTIVIVLNLVLIPALNFIVFLVKLIVRAVNLIIGFVNAILGVINSIISIIKKILSAIFLGGSINTKPPLVIKEIDEPLFISCMLIKCDGQEYAPGCIRVTSSPNCADNSLDFVNGGYCQGINKGMNHWANDGHGHDFNTSVTACGTYPPLPVLPLLNAGYIDCIQVVLAEALDVFEFDFYNDWVNGSLYSFLLKYKKKKYGDKFCEYDCENSNTPGVTNFCKSSHIVDTCQGSGLYAANGIIDLSIKDVGLIKETEDDELYYAPNNKLGNRLLFATDITNLGSVLDEDFQGIPQIHPTLQATTYLRPELTQDVSTTAGDVPEEAIDPLLFLATALALLTCTIHCRNISRICELGVSLPDASGGGIAAIDANSIEDKFGGDYARDVIAYLNDGTTASTQTLGSMVTKFGETNYNTYRDKSGGLANMRLAKKNSYYFYFGIIPGATAIDKANARFFTKCEVAKKNAFILNTSVNNVTTIGGTNGLAVISIVGGTAGYTYVLTNSLGVSTTQIKPATGPNPNVATFSSLAGGNYTVLVTDSLGNTAIGSLSISAPVGISYSLGVSDATSNGASDGTITVSSVAGGTGPYIATLTPTAGTLPINIGIGTTGVFTGLPLGSYTVTVSDVGGVAPDVLQPISVAEPAPLALSITVNTVVGCNGSNTGEFTITKSGQPPLTLETFEFPLTGNYDNGAAIPVITPYVGEVALMALVNADEGGLNIATLRNTQVSQTSVGAGIYVVRLKDSVGGQLIDSQTFAEPAVLTISAVPNDVLCKNGTSGSITASSSGGLPTYTYSIIGGIHTVATPFTTSPTFGGLGVGNYDITVKDGGGCEVTISNVQVDEPALAVVLTANQTNQTNAAGPSNDGTITLSATGGDGSFTFSMKPTGGTLVAGANHTGLVAGTYITYVSDGNGCTDTKNVTIV